MFLGEYLHSIDEKGRLTLPAKFKDAYADGLVVSEGFEESLALFTMVDWPKEAEKFRELESFDPDNRMLRRGFFAGADILTPDKNGRVVIPGSMRESIGLEKEAYIIGVYDHLEVWPKAKWDQYRSQARKTREVHAKRLAQK